MFALHIGQPGRPPRTHTTAQREVMIGASEGNDVVMRHASVADRHARLVVKDGKFILVDLRSDHGTFVNGRRITAPLVVRPTDEIRIGECTLAIEDLIGSYADEPTLEWWPSGEPPADDVEAALLAAIQAGDQASRLVYADWLEERGDAARARFLRLQEELAALPPERARVPLREAAEDVELAWRMKVARVPIENCEHAGADADEPALEFELRCPKAWSELAATPRAHVRHCGACDKPVYFSRTIDEARRHARRGECVAVDLVQLRLPGDLEPDDTPIMMGVIRTSRRR